MAGPSVVERAKHWYPRIRLVISVAMLAWLLRQIPTIRSLFPEWHASTFGWLAGALLFSILGILLSAIRWQRVLEGMELPAKLSTLLNAYLAGQFVSNFLPSTIGGDALRVTRLSASNGETPGTFASVVLDRMSGWLILPLLCLAGLAINPTLIHLGRASRAALAISFATLAGLVAVLAVVASPRLGGRLANHANWLRFAGAVHLGLDRLRRHPSAAIEVLATGFFYQFAMIGAAVLGSKALGIHVGPTAMIAFVPAVAIVQVLPLTIGGLGVREGAFVLFLQPLGVGTSQAIALGLLVYALHLASSLLGAPAFAVGNRSARAAA
jgi:glycosyltransferase 2 family protein